MNFTFISANITAKELRIYDARQKPFAIHGLYRPYEKGTFRRMPTEVAEKTSERVRILHTNTAGARLRFATDSTFIAIGAKYPPMSFPSERTAALCGAGAFCFDLCVDNEHLCVLTPTNTLQRGSIMSFDLESGRYEAAISFEECRMREITLCFPSFVDISELYVGLNEGSVVKGPSPYKNEKPVVFYGSSITQGACASRSGNIYQNILSRRLNFDYINLGFAGGCHAENAVIDYICSMDMSLLVFDYDHNTPSVEELEKTHLPALLKLRMAHPDIPIVLISKPNIHNGRAEAIRRMKVIEKSYRELSSESASPVHFINGIDIFDSLDSEMMTADGTHPTDLGFYCMAHSLYDVLKLYL